MDGVGLRERTGLDEEREPPLPIADRIEPQLEANGYRALPGRRLRHRRDLEPHVGAVRRCAKGLDGWFLLRPQRQRIAPVIAVARAHAQAFPAHAHVQFPIARPSLRGLEPDQVVGLRLREHVGDPFCRVVLVEDPPSRRERDVREPAVSASRRPPWMW